MISLGTVNLETERLKLRRFEIGDAEEVYSGYINQPEFLYYANKKEQSFDEVKSYIEHIIQKYEEKNYFSWLITKKDDNKIIGAINLKKDNKEDSVLFSYAIDNRFTGRGYMTEALSIVRDFAIKKLKVKKFIGGCVIENVASKKVMEKCGLKYEKMLKNYKELSDGKHDMHIYTILNK